jgi:hypothetical protein
METVTEWKKIGECIAERSLQVSAALSGKEWRTRYGPAARLLFWFTARVVAPNLWIESEGQIAVKTQCCATVPIEMLDLIYLNDAVGAVKA